MALSHLNTVHYRATSQMNALIERIFHLRLNLVSYTFIPSAIMAYSILYPTWFFEGDHIWVASVILFVAVLLLFRSVERYHQLKVSKAEYEELAGHLARLTDEITKFHEANDHPYSDRDFVIFFYQRVDLGEPGQGIARGEWHRVLPRSLRLLAECGVPGEPGLLAAAIINIGPSGACSEAIESMLDELHRSGYEPAIRPLKDPAYRTAWENLLI